MKFHRIAFLFLIYVASYFILFSPRMYDISYKSDQTGNRAVAEPSLRWLNPPATLESKKHKLSVLNRLITIMYSPMIILDIKINHKKYEWQYGQPKPAWVEDYL